MSLTKIRKNLDNLLKILYPKPAKTFKGYPYWLYEDDDIIDDLWQAEVTRRSKKVWEKKTG